MKAFPPVEPAHPHHVLIPQADTEGLRSYREPDELHPLQFVFLDPAGEQAGSRKRARCSRLGAATRWSPASWPISTGSMER